MTYNVKQSVACCMKAFSVVCYPGKFEINLSKLWIFGLKKVVLVFSGDSGLEIANINWTNQL